MIKKYVDTKNNFIELFNSHTGFYIRSGVIQNGVDTGIDPFMRNFPQLIDIGIMGSCVHGSNGLCIKSGVQCYQNGLKIHKPNMSLENFKKIVDQCKGRTFQFALGGRGDVDQHEYFKDILSYCQDNQIIPNFTSSGLGFTEDIVDTCKRYCGAVAISWYRAEHTYKAINMLLEANIKTNIHYVLGNNTIDEAIERLSNNDFPKGINAVIFLLHKPIGLGSKESVLSISNQKVKQFFELIDSNDFNFKIGFDSCSCAGIINLTKSIDYNTIDYCEGARYSCYIDAQMNMMPCSFGNSDSYWHVSLNKYTIEQAWHSREFNMFRYSLRNSCRQCDKRLFCGGGCPFTNEITLCDREERDFKCLK